MPGHDSIAGLTGDQIGTPFEGKFIEVGSGAPSTSANIGVGRGGLYIRTDGGATNTTLYCNRGTAGTPDWCSVDMTDL